MTSWRAALRRGRWPLAAALVAIATALVASLALADNIRDDIVVEPGVRTVTAGGAGTIVKYGIQATGAGGMPGCDATPTSPVTITPNLPAGVTASPTSVMLESCPDALVSAASITYSAGLSMAAGNYSITVGWTDSAGMYSVDNAAFTLQVEAAPLPADTTPPAITPSVTGTLGANGWYVTDVTVSWGIVDNESTVTSTTGCGTTTVETDTAGVTLTCSATSAGGTATESVTVKRDATDPVLNPTVSPDPVLLNGSATASPNATDATSGLASSSCDPVDTGSVGAKTVSCTATDDAGNTSTASASYSVIFDFDGFFQPIDDLPTVNTVKAGSSVPVKFSLNGDQGLSIFAAGSPSSRPMSCSSTTPSDPVEETSTAGGSSLKYDALLDQYVYVWKTEKGWANTCRQLTVKLADGTSHTASFRLK